jgi:glycosyltransferase involved in cell wall biosynthesis
VPYVVDYDDAVFHNYDQSRSALIRAVFGHKIDRVMEQSALVLAGNSYLADRARAAGASRVEIIPSVVDLIRYPSGLTTPHRGLVVGWIGSPGSQHLLEPIAPVLEKALDSADDRFVTIGANFAAPLFGNHEMIPWSEEREANELSRFDIGIMPVADRPFERGKCGFKLIQYMASGVAVIASPVGVNPEIVAQGANGFLADSNERWLEALLTLKRSPELRASMGRAGRTLVEERYSVAATAPRLLSLLRQTASQH